MKATIKLTLVASLFFMISSFSKIDDNGLDLTFGVSNSDPSQIELNLNKDYTFTYQDLSVSENKIMVEGSYEVKNNKVILIPTNDQTKFHDTWKISEDHTTAKSRKGITFYTLRRK